MRKKKPFKKDIASIKQELLEIKNMVEMKNLKKHWRTKLMKSPESEVKRQRDGKIGEDTVIRKLK